MKIDIQWIQSDRPQFNLALATAEGKPHFLTVKGCRIIEGSKGKFISWPSTKNEKTDKWWQHVYVSEAFAEIVLAEALKTQPKPDTRTHAERKKPTVADDDDSLIQF
jgi:DNA-binding cell septation regulator SpoVG